MFKRKFENPDGKQGSEVENLKKAENLSQFIDAIKSLEDLNKQDEIVEKIKNCRNFSDFRTFLRDLDVPEENVRNICLRLENFVQDVGDKIIKKQEGEDFNEDSGKNIFKDQRDKWINKMGESPALAALFDILRSECAKYLTKEGIKKEKK